MKPKGKSRAFLLVELMVTMAILSIVVSAAFITGASLIKRYTDKRSNFRIESEAEEAASWLRSIVTRALWNKSDFTLMVSNDAVEPWMYVKWKTSGEREFWRGENVAFKTIGNATGMLSNYSYKYQTLTPALSINIYYKDDLRTRSGWKISASGYGYIRAYYES